MALNAHGVNAEGLMAGAAALAQPADNYGNDERVEALWALKAMEQAEVYFNILCSVDPKAIPRLSPCDNEIVTKFREIFPSLNVAKLTEEDLKSEKAKQTWRTFCEEFKHVDEYSFATLLRLDSSSDYSEANSIIVTKIQFYAIELSRNREGHNDVIRQNFKPVPRKPRAATTAPAGEFQPAMMSEVERELQQIITGNHKLLQ